MAIDREVIEDVARAERRTAARTEAPPEDDFTDAVHIALRAGLTSRVLHSLIDRAVNHMQETAARKAARTPLE